MTDQQGIAVKLKTGEMTMDQVLYPERHIADFELDALKIDIVPCGFPSLDEYQLLKVNRSELILVGGRPSSGKSAFMFQLAYNVAQRSCAHVFSLEMDTDQIRSRLLTHVINKSLSHIQKGMVSSEVLERGRKELAKLNYHVDDTAGLNVFQLCDRARNAHKHLQLLRVDKSHSKDDEIGIISRSLKELAKELRVPVIVGSQLNRACEIRGKEVERLSKGEDKSGYKPILSDLRESGNLEQDADMVLFVHRPSQFTDHRHGEADILIAKNRNGPVGEVCMDFTSNQTRFIDRGVAL
jgi:replicative DNA helicase